MRNRGNVTSNVTALTEIVNIPNHNSVRGRGIIDVDANGKHMTEMLFLITLVLADHILM